MNRDKEARSRDSITSTFLAERYGVLSSVLLSVVLSYYH